jgi:hypothetical protein
MMFLGENVGPRLVADFQRVAETLRGQQQGAVALALQQRVGGNRRAHLDRVDLFGRDALVSCHAHQVADALDGGVLVAFRVFRQQLVGLERAVRHARHQVGKRAAPVDPEIPSRHVACSRYCVVGLANVYKLSIKCQHD